MNLNVFFGGLILFGLCAGGYALFMYLVAAYQISKETKRKDLEDE